MMPSILRHRAKQVLIRVHVDDELVASSTKEETEWFLTELRKKYRIQTEGPFPEGRLGANEELGYLKKTFLFKADGIYIRPNPKYVENLLQIYDLCDRTKQVPEHASLRQVDVSEELDNEGQARLKSGLGDLRVSLPRSH